MPRPQTDDPCDDPTVREDVMKLAFPSNGYCEIGCSR